MTKEFFRMTAKGLAIATFSLGMVSSSAPVARALDIDSDTKDDYTTFRPSEGTWYVLASGSSTGLSYQWGLPGDYPTAGNFRSGSIGEFGVWRPTDGVWYLRFNTSSLVYSTAASYQWGLPGDSPQPCDYNGDGRTDLTVFRSSDGTWYQRNSTTDSSTSYSTAVSQQWGLPGDTAIAADYDGDSKCDYTVWRGGNWYIILSGQSTPTGVAIPWGAAGDIPVPGDYDGDSIMDFAIYRANSAQGPIWVIRRSSALSNLATFSKTYQWGLAGDQPVPGDYDGDGHTDIAVYRPSNGTWYVRTSSSNYATATAQQWGLPEDISFGTRRGMDPSVSSSARR